VSELNSRKKRGRFKGILPAIDEAVTRIFRKK